MTQKQEWQLNIITKVTLTFLGFTLFQERVWLACEVLRFFPCGVPVTQSNNMEKNGCPVARKHNDPKKKKLNATQSFKKKNNKKKD